MTFIRQKEFQRNENLESLLKEINGLIGPVEDRILQNFSMPEYPVVLIVGCGRSGSTLIMQWLASTGQFGYPTNLLSRFYQAPYLGARIQQLLTDPRFNFRDEFQDFNNTFSYDSDLGKTQGILAPNEFWYFWRRFFHYGDIQYLDQRSLEGVDRARFAAELASLEAAFEKPFAMKGMIINWNIPFVSNILDKVLFVYIKRHPILNVQSMLEAREKFYADRSLWYSFKPPEYNFLKDLNPMEQVSGQVYFTNAAIEEGLSQIDPNRWLIVEYEAFCENPKQVFLSILEKFTRQGFYFDWPYIGMQRFDTTNEVRLPGEDLKRILKAYKRFSGKDITV
ncbi:MAG: hypothetical protein A2029_15465 [Chloroflexi bacterium RBG_19FT_COMBO_47_9]|nr:MAG: hypothetical protein A2029_15465 [Chloroflexi bacterium RBG_19FT_COMBO_47_9]